MLSLANQPATPKQSLSHPTVTSIKSLAPSTGTVLFQVAPNDAFLRFDSEIIPLTPAAQEAAARHEAYFAGTRELLSKHIACFWRPEEADMSDLQANLAKHKSRARRLVERIQVFFLFADNDVLGTLLPKILQSMPHNATCQFLAYQTGAEVIHQRAYEQLLQAMLGMNPRQLQVHFGDRDAFRAVHLMRDFALAYTQDPQTPLVQLVLTLILVEGLFFSAAFAIVFNFKNCPRGSALPAFTTVNEWIQRDEGLHLVHGTELFKQFANQPSVPEIHGMVRQAIAVQDHFIDDAFVDALPVFTLTPARLKEYVRYVADFIMGMIEVPPVYNVKENPLDYMAVIGADMKTNFFERRNTSYQVAIREELTQDAFSCEIEF